MSTPSHTGLSLDHSRIVEYYVGVLQYEGSGGEGSLCEIGMGRASEVMKALGEIVQPLCLYVSLAILSGLYQHENGWQSVVWSVLVLIGFVGFVSLVLSAILLVVDTIRGRSFKTAMRSLASATSYQDLIEWTALSSLLCGASFVYFGSSRGTVLCVAWLIVTAAQVGMTILKHRQSRIYQTGHTPRYPHTPSLLK